ncbi:MAG TPA: dienelactone hydrolase family protein, partial [Pyrinomonadaceae bacterium]|nr:dienelactone hydrolase family protein [Pyrinomonadaceae bacterium]
MLTETLTFETAGGPTTAFVAMPDGETGQAVLLIHEWWGLNQHIKDIAGRYAAEGFIAIAPDLYRGSVATNPEDASKMMHALAIEDGLDT